MSNKENQDNYSFSVNEGATVNLNCNIPMRFEIETVGGSTISGVTTPEHPVSIKMMHDIADINLRYDEALVASWKSRKS